MPNRAAEQMSFGWRVNEAHFRGGALRSNGGPMPLRQVDRRIGLTCAVAAVPSDRLPSHRRIRQIARFLCNIELRCPR
jgi:hypothetical protein